MQQGTRTQVIALSAAIGFCATLAVGWPAATYADDPAEAVAEQAQFPEGFTKIGPLMASSRFVQDERVKSKWYVEIKVKNQSTEGPETGQIEARIEKATYEPESRGMPMGAVVWKETETVVVPAGEAVTLRRPLPAGLAWGVYQAHQPVAEAGSTQAYMRRRTTYRTFILDKEAEADEGDRL